MIALVSGLLSGAGQRLLIVGAGVLAVGLVLLGAYRKGVRAQQYADQARTLRLVRRNQKVRQDVEREILESRRPHGAEPGRSAVEQLHQSWQRD